MRKLAFVLLAAAAGIILIPGCGVKVDGVPSTVATVNGTPITAEVYLSQLHRMMGRDVLRNLLEQVIILKWAEDEKVPPTKEQIDKAIAALKREGEYEDRVKQMGEDGLRRQLEVEQAVTNLVKKFYKIKESDLKDMYSMRESAYVHGPRKRVALIIVDDKKKIEEIEKKIKGGADFDEVGAEYVNNPFGPPGPFKTWLDPEAVGLPPALGDAAKETKVGQVSKIFELEDPGGTRSQWGILKVVDEQGEANLKLEDVRFELEKMVAMQKIQMESADFQKRLNERKRKADIKINAPDLKGIAAAFRNPPEPPAPPPAPKQAPKQENRNQKDKE